MPPDLARAIDRMIFGMIEIVGVIGVEHKLPGKVFGLDDRIFDPAVSVEPSKIGKRKGFGRGVNLGGGDQHEYKHALEFGAEVCDPTSVCFDLHRRVEAKVLEGGEYERMSLKVSFAVCLIALGLITFRSHASVLRYALPTSPRAPHLRFEAVLGDHQDELLVSEDQGSHWRAVFRGHISSLQLPLRRQDAVNATAPAFLDRNFGGLGGEKVDLEFSDEELDPRRWSITLISHQHTVVVTRKRTFRLPDLGRIQRIKFLDSGWSFLHNFQIISARGASAQGTYVFFDDRPALEIASIFTERPLIARLAEHQLEFLGTPRPGLAPLEPIEINENGIARHARAQRFGDQAREIMRRAQIPDAEHKERYVRELLDSHLLLQDYILAHAPNKTARFERAARVILRHWILKDQDRLVRYAQNPRTRMTFDQMIDDLADLWFFGQMQYEPLMEMVRSHLAGRPNPSAAECASDLNGIRSPKFYDLEKIRGRLDSMRRELRYQRWPNWIGGAMFKIDSELKAMRLGSGKG